jgi:hypothetical protein
MVLRVSRLLIRTLSTLRRASIAFGAAAPVLGAVGAATPSWLGAQATAVRVSHDLGNGGGTIVQQPTSGTRYGPPESVRRRGSELEAVPPQYAPPSGMCRIWVHGVPATQQPAPTQCANAVRVRSANSQVVFGNSHPTTVASGSGTGTVVGPRLNERPLGTSQVTTAGGGGASGTPTTGEHVTSSTVAATGTRVAGKDHNPPQPRVPTPSHNPPAPHVSVRAHR